MTTPENKKEAEKRYVIEALIGPCSPKEAEAFLDVVSDHLEQGACWSLRVYNESAEEAAEEGPHFLNTSEEAK